MANNNNKVYEIVTNKIVEALKSGVCPWQKGWQSRHYMNRYGKSYSWLNSILLYLQGKDSGEFITFEQAKKEGGKVRKGARSAMVTFYTIIEKEVTDPESGEVTKKSFPYLRYYNVFHIDDVEGLEPKHYDVFEHTETEPFALAEETLSAYLNAEGAPRFYDNEPSQAYYSPTTDAIHVPNKTQFEQLAAYWQTVWHETIHSTAHKSRLNRTLGKEFGDKDYSREELCAEIGSAFMMQLCGINTEGILKNTAAYCDHWVQRLTEDPRAFAIAAARAEKAANWVLGDRSQAKKSEDNTKSTERKKVA